MATVTRKTAAKADVPASNKNATDVGLSPADEQAIMARMSHRDLRYKAQRLWKSAADSRKRYDWEWLTRDLFRRGFHFSRYNPSSRTVVLATRSNVKIPINLVHAQMRTIKNQVTSVRPKWEVMPTGSSPDAQSNARYSGKLLDYYYDRLGLRKKIKETVIQGLEYSVGGPWQVGYDPNGGGDGSGEVFLWLLDPFDFYIDPNATSMDDAEYCIKAVRRSLSDIKANPNYKFYNMLQDIHGEMKQAASEYKQFLLQALKYYQSGGNEAEQEGAILYEAWIKARVTEENLEELTQELLDNDQDTKDLRLGEVIMRKVTYVDFLEDPLDVQTLRRPDFPFVLFQADVNPMEIYGESWIKHVIPINRVVNALESSVFKFNYKYAVGRIVIDKNSGVRIISNEHGDIIEKNAGAEVSAMPLAPLPQSYQEQIANFRMYGEDIGGAHEVSMGRIPAGIKSGIGIAELKSADSINQQDLLDGMEDFLVEVGKKLLREIAEHYDVPKVIKVLGRGGDPEHFTVIGAQAAKGRKKLKEVKIGTDTFNLAIIGNDNEVRVSVGTWLAYTREARLDQLREYFQSGLIDQQTFLENAEFPDIKNILKRTRDATTLKAMGNTMVPGTNVTEEEIAEQENILMQKEGVEAKPGGVWPMPTDNHAVHLVVHQEVLGVSGDPNIQAHMTEHERQMRAQQLGPMPNQPTQPQQAAQPQPGMPQPGAQPPGGPPTGANGQAAPQMAQQLMSMMGGAAPTPGGMGAPPPGGAPPMGGGMSPMM